jgi:hypothetical protein
MPINAITVPGVRLEQLPKRAQAVCFLREAVTDMKHVQDQLGHVDMKTTQLYTPITNSTSQKVNSPFGKLMSEVRIPRIVKWGKWRQHV